jgi:hypothetical protein
MNPDSTARPRSPKERLLAELAAAPSPTRPTRRTRAWLAYGGATVAMVAVFFAFGGPAHARGRPLVDTISIALGATLLAVVSTRVGLGRGGSMVGRPSRALALVAIAVPIATFAWLFAWHGHYVEPFQRLGLRCLALTLTCASALLMVMFWLRARTVVRAPALHGAVMGAAAGAWAGVAVDLWCPLTGPAHVALGHVLPIGLLILLSAAIGRVILVVRARQR